MDAVVEYMKQKNIPLTRDRYLNLAYMGEVPEPLSAEEEAQIPEEIKGGSNGGQTDLQTSS